jgi:hypothetical protein
MRASRYGNSGSATHEVCRLMALRMGREPPW